MQLCPCGIGGGKHLWDNCPQKRGGGAANQQANIAAGAIKTHRALASAEEATHPRVFPERARDR